VQIGFGGAGAATAYALLSCGTSRLDLYDVEAPQADDLADRMRVHFPTQTVATIATEDLPAVMPQDSVGGDPADDHVADRGPEVVAVGRRTQVPTE